MPPMPPMSFMSLVTLFDQRQDYSYHQVVNAVAEKETELGLAEEEDPSLDQTEYSGDSDDESDHNEMGMTWSTAHSSGSAAPLRLAWVLNAVLLIALVVCYRSTTGTTPEAAEELIVSTSTPQPAQGWVRPDKIFGLVHVAKTGGTTLSGDLPLQYERVCGNKGYSYDAYKHNERVREQGWSFELNDSVNKLYKNHNRGKVPGFLMDEIGWDDCDYIALEVEGEYWNRFADEWPMELHIPCRDPLDHLMSLFNFAQNTFDCNTTHLKWSLFHGFKPTWVDDRVRGLVDQKPHPNITVKCFDPMPPQRYINYMGGILQHKRIQGEHVFVPTNLPRHKDQECIWQASEEFREQVLQVLRKNTLYFDYCHRCMGSADELVLN